MARAKSEVAAAMEPKRFAAKLISSSGEVAAFKTVCQFGSATAHLVADEILLAALRAGGRQDVVDAYEQTRKKIKFWFE